MTYTIQTVIRIKGLVVYCSVYHLNETLHESGCTDIFKQWYKLSIAEGTAAAAFVP